VCDRYRKESHEYAYLTEDRHKFRGGGGREGVFPLTVVTREGRENLDQGKRRRRREGDLMICIYTIICVCVTPPLKRRELCHSNRGSREAVCLQRTPKYPLCQGTSSSLSSFFVILMLIFGLLFRSLCCYFFYSYF